MLTAIDVKDTLHKKLGVDFRRYKILCACNPGLGHQALPADGPHAPVQRRGQPSP